MNTRRQFLISAPLPFLVAAPACRNETQPPANSQTAQSPPAGAPPTFGTGKGSGPAVSPETFAEAEKLVQVELTPAERQQAADSWRESMAPYLERRTGPRKVAIEATDTPATLWNPVIPGLVTALPSMEGRRRGAAIFGRRHRVRARHATFEVDRVAQAHVRAPDEHLPRAR